MKMPVDPPLKKELHHHLWSSIESWKYVNATVMQAVTINKIIATRNKIPNNW